MKGHGDAFTCLEDHVQELSSSVKDIPVITANETGLVPDKGKACEVVERRLVGHRQDADRRIGGNFLPITRHTAAVSRKDMLEITRHINKGIKKSTVILVPKYRGNPQIPGIPDQSEDGTWPVPVDIAGLLGEHVAPFPCNTMKCRLYEHKVRTPVAEDILIVLWRHTADTGIDRQADGRKKIRHKRDLEAAEGTWAKCVLRDDRMVIDKMSYGTDQRTKHISSPRMYGTKCFHWRYEMMRSLPLRAIVAQRSGFSRAMAST